jgi:HlyD family secretion protein
VVQFVTCQTAVRASVLALAHGVHQAMSFARWSKVASVLLVVGAAVSGVGMVAQRRAPAAPLRPERGANGARADDLVTFQTRPGTLAVTVGAVGSLEASSNQVMYNTVEGPTTILQILPERTQVKKGQIVCELNSASPCDRLISQRVATATAEAAYQNAKIALDVAQLAVTEYTNGTFVQKLKTAKAEVAAALTAVHKAENRLERVRRARQRLSDALNRSQRSLAPSDIVAELDIEDRLDATEEALSRTQTALELAKSKQDILEKYTKDKAQKALQADVERKRADAVAATATREIEQTKERKLEGQIAACTIKAPGDGLVVYANDPYRDFRRERVTIGEGATVRNKQKLFSLPDVTRMQLHAKVHESEIAKVARGMMARIRVDAFPDQVLDGTVVDVAGLPDPPGRGGKVFTSKIRIDNPLPGLRPGMTAQHIEILVAKHDNVLTVPVQAVVRYEAKEHVAVKIPGGGFEWREVTLGISNDSFVEITQGINGGDTVVLNSTSLMSDKEKHDKLGDRLKESAPR